MGVGIPGTGMAGLEIASALSQLITIHIKSHIGKLSPVRVGHPLLYQFGGGHRFPAERRNQGNSVRPSDMISHISGLICDGAKSSCALKIASSLASAVQCAQLAMAGVSAARLDGIIAEDAEISIPNPANLGSEANISGSIVLPCKRLCFMVYSFMAIMPTSRKLEESKTYEGL